MSDPDIYFAGSIRGGRSDQPVYARLVEILDRHGTVLSEHVGAAEVDESGMTDAEIHDQDLAWLRQADLVVAEVTTPSLGVGYELGRAAEWGRPICCLYRPKGAADLSAMVRGSSTTRVVEYDDPDAVADTLARFVAQHA